MGGRGVGRVLPPLVHRPAARVHEEVRDCGGVEAELASDGNLHFFRRALRFLKEAKHSERMFGRRGERSLWVDGKREIIAFALVL